MELDERTRAELAATTRFRDLRLLTETASTNADVSALARAGAPEGLVVVADHQTAGRGRLDRRWEARPGDGLLASVLLRPSGLPPDRLHLVTAAVALSAQDACAEAAGVAVDVKWPNDLLVGETKLAGVLAEVLPGAVVVGMGLNVHGGPPGAAVLDEVAGQPVRRERLLVAWLQALDGLAGDWDRVAREYGRRCSTVGRTVRLETSPGVFVEGIAAGVEPDGRLVVLGSDGTRTAFAAGDVTHLR